MFLGINYVIKSLPNLIILLHDVQNILTMVHTTVTVLVVADTKLSLSLSSYLTMIECTYCPFVRYIS